MAEIEPINNFETNSRRSSGAGQTARRRPSGPEPVGRYDRRTQNTRVPADGPAREPRSDNIETVIVAVQDPWGNGKERLLATVNRKVDLLENERSHDRISEAAYRTGRLIQEIFERLGTVSGTNWCGASRIDPALANHTKIVRSLESAREIQKLVDQMRGRIGMIDLRLLRRLLGDRLTFAECANLQGKSGDRGQSYIAARFRDALEDLAESWVGKGKVLPAPIDKHSEAVSGVEERQAVSIKKGVTAARRAAEAKETEKRDD